MLEVGPPEIEALPAQEPEPGVPQGIAKLSANGLWVSVCRATRGE